MSIEVGHSMMHVFVRDPERSGITYSEIESMQREIEATAPESTELHATLGIVLEHAQDHGGVVSRLREENKYILGITAHKGMRDSDLDIIGGLLFAEAADQQPDTSFSEVRMDTWMRPHNVHPRDMDTLREEMLYMGLNKVEDPRKTFGVPVNRLTRIVPLHPTDEENPDGYVYGYEGERSAVQELDLPPPLVGLLSFITKAWQHSETMNAGHANFADIQDALHDRFF